MEKVRKPFFSVIIPTLNEENYLPRLLEELSKQTYQDFEVIVTDGGSTDATIARAKAFAKKLPWFTLFTNRKRNVSFQRNFGAKKSNGQFLIFLDADSQIPIDFLEGIKKSALGGHKFITTYFATHHRDIRDQAVIWIINLVVWIGKIIGKPIAVGANTIVERKVFERVGGFDETVVHAEDYTLTQAILKSGVPLTILTKPRFYFSLRRHHAEGRAKVLWKNLVAAVYVLFKRQDIKKELFEYEMGGEKYVHNR